MHRIAIKIIRKIGRMISYGGIRLRWYIFFKYTNKLGVRKALSGEELIISLTSYPGRIKTVNQTIESLLMQNIKPNHIILWLAKEQFKNQEKDLPDKLLKLCKYGLEIKWCNDLRSYKKLIPTLELYPEAVIVTADDDICYRNNWLKLLYSEHKKKPDLIWAYRITKFSIKNQKYEIIPGGYDKWQRPSFLHKLTGAGGVLYPKNCFLKDIVKQDIFMKECSTNDDIWFWVMAVLNGVKIGVVPSDANRNLIYIPGTQKGETLSKINDSGEKKFWKDFKNMLKYYPELNVIFQEEQMRLLYEMLNG